MDSPLVSVIVITYNSSATVVETLESIKSQTYPNIELIISDDCSKDDTVDVCRKWLDNNSSPFVSTNLVTVDKNTGTSANCNRGWRNSKGDWIKFIAGDDRLLPNCIFDNIDYYLNNTQSDIIFSKAVPFGDIEEGYRLLSNGYSMLFEIFSKRQITMIICGRNLFCAPSSFIKKDTLHSLGGFDETIPLIEDWPFWMKASYCKYELRFMNKDTVEYRFSNSSISQGSVSEKFLESKNRCVERGKYYLKNIDIFAKFYCYTMFHASDCFMIRILHCLNILNPFYYEYNRCLEKFEDYKRLLENR